MNEALVNAIAAAGFRIDRRLSAAGDRFTRARELVQDGLVVVTGRSPLQLEAEVNYRHKVVIQLDPQHAVTGVRCSCQDWCTRGLQYRQPCKHILALALEIGDVPIGEAASIPPSPPPVSVPPAPLSFPQQVRRAVGQAIQDLARQVDALLMAGHIPFLLGPTGSGKTSAIRQVAAARGWGYEEVAGAQSFVDADLVGLRTDHMCVPGVLARAFQRAQAGETVLVCIDELTRFNARVPDLLMRPLQVAPVEVARSLGLPADSAVRLCEAPTWGQIWAPAARLQMALAANPWGASLDAALIRRVEPFPVTFSQDVLRLFTGAVAGGIQASWQAEAEGQLPLPLEYQALLAAEAPDDAGLFPPYLRRLAALDKAAASGFATLLKGMGLAVSER